MSSLDQLSPVPRTKRSPLPAGHSSDLSAIDRDLRGVLNSKVIAGLDAVRALAIFLVLVEHTDLYVHLFHTHPFVGSMGVMIFFVLSGFLITSMLLREYQRAGAISLRTFYRNRTYRIFPSFYVCWILTTLVEYLAHKLQWRTAALAFFYFMDYGRGLQPSWFDPNSHMWISWSLAVEEKFYLLWPLLLIFLLKNRSTLIRNLSLIILGQWIYRAILFLGFHITWDHVYCTFDMRADALLAGCLLAIVLQDQKGRLLSCQLLRWQWLSILPMGILFVVMLTILPKSNRYLLITFWTLQPVIIAMMMVQFMYWGSKSWAICRSAPVRFIAHISYALYLYHPLAGEITQLLHMRHLGYPVVLLTPPLAIASYYLVEKPFMRMRDRGVREEPSPATATATAP